MSSKLKINESNPTAVSLFAGAGGCSLGFLDAGYKIIYACDKWTDAVDTYRMNFPDSHCEVKDIRDLDPKTNTALSRLKKGELDILIGGPPCQGFSTAGARFWDDPRNHLLKHYVGILDALKPKWFLMENVEGLLTTKNGQYIHETLKRFLELGYNVRLEKIYAQEYGIPQRRKRVVVVGNRLGFEYQFPSPTTSVQGRIFRKAEFTLREAIHGLPEPSSKFGEDLLYTSTCPVNEFDRALRNGAIKVSDHYVPVVEGLQLERIKVLKQGQTMKDLPDYLQHESFKRRANRRVMDGTPSDKRGGAPSGLKRLIDKEPCLTITGSATREFIHPIQDRPLTIRECARIQTFPDTFAFAGNDSSKIKQIGNAIPPKLAFLFADHIRMFYGFEGEVNNERGKLLGFRLTKAEAMSPALQNTDTLLSSLLSRRSIQGNLFASG